EIGNYDGHRAVVVKSRAATTGAAALIKKVVDEASTTIDVDTGRPLAFESLFAMGARSTTAKATFVGNRAEITYMRNDETKPHTLRVDYGRVTAYDAHSAMAVLRGWKATPGTSRSVYVAGGRPPGGGRGRLPRGTTIRPGGRQPPPGPIRGAAVPPPADPG